MPRETSANRSDVDLAVGTRMRMRRKLLGMSQVVLAERIGVTFQLVQNYEKGSNRIGSSRLPQIAKILCTNPTSLFGKGDTVAIACSPEMTAIDEMMVTADGAARAFMKIVDPNIKRSILALVKSLAKRDSDKPERPLPPSTISEPAAWRPSPFR